MPKPVGPRTYAEMICRQAERWKRVGWERVFGTPDQVSEWSVYGYEWVDDLNWMPPAEELFRDWPLGAELLARVGERFREVGWEGDGVFQVFWLPPFLGLGVENLGCYGLLVKQDNDGTSWIACPAPLGRLGGFENPHPFYAALNAKAEAEARELIEEEAAERTEGGATDPQGKPIP